jgi:hypothetical protein
MVGKNHVQTSAIGVETVSVMAQDWIEVCAHLKIFHSFTVFTCSFVVLLVLELGVAVDPPLWLVQYIFF